ncbi:hypothetical protein Tco_0641780 [Tanacetum coccineum]
MGVEDMGHEGVPHHCQLMSQPMGTMPSLCSMLFIFNSLNAATSIDTNLAQASPPHCYVTQGHPDWYYEFRCQRSHRPPLTDNVSHSVSPLIAQSCLQEVYPCVLLVTTLKLKVTNALNLDSSRIYITHHARFDEAHHLPIRVLCPIPTTTAEPLHEPDSTLSSPYSSEDDNPPTDSDDMKTHSKIRNIQDKALSRYSPDFVTLHLHALHAALFSLCSAKVDSNPQQNIQLIAAMHMKRRLLKQNCGDPLIRLIPLFIDLCSGACYTSPSLCLIYLMPGSLEDIPRDTENEAVRLMMFSLSLTGEAKTWLDELNQRTIETKGMLQNCHGHNLSKGNTIKIFYYGLSEITQEVLNAAAGGIFLYKTPNQAYQLLKDKVLLKLDWAKNQKTKSSFKKTIAFAAKGSSNTDTDKIIARMDAMTIKMDA